jgi:Metal-dependent hydrolases of the beta-lactamase superfamily I
MRVTLLGTGDTTGTPTVGCTCDTCREARERGVSRSRFSVHVANERTGESLLVDFSPDFRSQFLDNDVTLPDAGIVTHIHFDHLDGLGNVYRLVDGLPVHAPSETDPATDQSVADTIRTKYDYLEDRIGVHARDPFEPFETCGFSVRFVPVDHPPLLCFGVTVSDPDTGAKLSLTATRATTSRRARARRSPTPTCFWPTPSFPRRCVNTTRSAGDTRGRAAFPTPSARNT